MDNENLRGGAVVLKLRTEAVLGYGWKGEGGDEAREVWG